MQENRSSANWLRMNLFDVVSFVLIDPAMKIVMTIPFARVPTIPIPSTLHWKMNSSKLVGSGVEFSTVTGTSVSFSQSEMFKFGAEVMIKIVDHDTIYCYFMSNIPRKILIL